MSPLLTKSHSAPNLAFRPSVVSGARYAEPLEGVELALIEIRARIVGALDRELEAVRALRSGRRAPSSKLLESHPEVPPPTNVVTLGREMFAQLNEPPIEAALDPALERATVDELNAALAAAFSQMSEP